MDIYLDFDGTLVEHEYPKIGRENFGGMRVVKRLQDAGNRIILNTYRADLGEGLAEAIDWVNFHREVEMTLDGVTDKKIHPEWKPETAATYLFIDDQATGIPLKPAVMTQGKMVDWDKVEKILEQYKII